MPLVIENPTEKVFEIWKSKMEKVVDGLSMEASEKVYNGKSYARLLYLGSTIAGSDLEGDECAVKIDFQTECFCSGYKSLTAVYKIDETSRKAMVDMGFRCTYQNSVENIDETIKRVVSRYSMLYTGQLLGEE